MITETRVRVLAREDGVTAGLAEKNYVNSWILYALYTSELRDPLVFKGGTALSKLYFPQIWRFSEDLDFTVTAGVDDPETQVGNALTRIEPESGIRFEIDNVHVAGTPTEYVQVDVQYDAVLGQRNTTTLDLTFDEELAFPTERHEHEFEDIPDFELVAYSIEEILVEKLRSLFQRARARDYYDIYRILNQREFDDQRIREALQTKSQQQNVELQLNSGIPAEEVDDVRTYWDQALDRLVTDKPEFTDVVHSINCYLETLNQAQ